MAAAEEGIVRDGKLGGKRDASSPATSSLISN